MLNKNNIQDIYQLSPMQEGIYFHSLIDRDSDPYFSQTTYQVEGHLEPELMEESLNLLVQRHDVLRTVFNHKKADQILQVVLKERKASFQLVDIRDLTPSAKEIFLTHFKEEDHQRGFQLNKDNLLRVSVIQMTDRQYEFIWSAHHIIMDGWCQSILIEEFQEIYFSLLQKEKPKLKTPCQYRSFIDWLAKQNVATAKDFWRNYLEGYTTKQGLFQTRTAATDEYDNREIVLDLPLTLSNQLRQLAADKSLTLSGLLKAAWGIVLAKYQCNEEALFGLVSSIRPAEIPNVDRAIGIFINTVPVRVSCPSDWSYIELAQQLQQDQLAMDTPAFLPLSEIQKESSLKQHLIDHTFIFENFPPSANVMGKESAASDIPQVDYMGSYAQTNYNFNIIILPNETITVKLNYNGTVLTDNWVNALGQHFQYLLEQIIADPQQPINHLKLLREEAIVDLQRLNGDAIQYPELPGAFAYFEKQVLENPQSPALLCETTSWTYQDLSEKADQIAQHLLAQPSFSRGSIIAVFLDRSPNSIASLLGIWKAGGVYLPISIDQPPARIRHLLDDAQALGILCEAKDQEKLMTLGTTPICLEDCWSATRESIAAVQVQKTDLAYVIYTSGTTGQPKGVPIRHESIVNQILFHNDYLQMQKGERFLHLASLAFDASLVEILMPLFSGGTVVIAPQHLKENTEKLTEYLEVHRVNTAIFPPAYLRLLEQVDKTELRKIISTGEAIITEDALKYSKEIDIYNGYGPTECCIGATFHKVDAALQQAYLDAGGIPIGKPFANTAVYIVNQHLEMLPRGLMGEICVSGIGLCEAYLHQPELSASKFFPNPYARYAHEQWLYRTGDLGRWNEAGEIEFCGRIDDQIQLSGIRVEPKEIAARIRQMDSVKMALVDQVQQDDWLVLTAFVESDQDLSEMEVQTYLQEYLPAYMIPRRIVVLQKFPLTGNGKIDKEALLNRGTVDSKKDSYNATSQTKEEKLLCQILSNALKQPNLSLNSDFFHLGGDSIKAIQIVSRLYRQGYTLEVKDIFNFPIIGQMAQKIRLIQSLSEQGMVLGKMPLTPIQHAFFAMNLQRPWQFNHAELFESQLPLEEKKVRKIIQKLLEHHDVLRTSFARDEKGVMTATIADKHILPRVMDVDLTKESDVLARRTEFCQLLQSSFQLDQAPLLAAAIFHEKTGDHLFIVVHHLVFDGISWRIFLEDLQLLFEQSRQGQALELPPKTDSFKLWSEQLSLRANSDAMQEEMAYWSSPEWLQTEIIPLTPSTDKGVDQLSFTLNAEATQKLRTKVPQAYATEINHILLSVFAKTAQQVWGCRRLAVMLEGHGREEILPGINISRTIGWFTDMYPVALDAQVENDDWGRLIKTTKENLLAIPNKGIGYGMIKYLRSGGAELLPAQEPNVLFNYLGEFDEGTAETTVLQSVDAPVGDSTFAEERPGFALSLVSMIVDGQLQMRFQFDKSEHQRAEIEQLMKQYEQQLNQIIDHCVSLGKKLSPDRLTYKDLSSAALERLQKSCEELGTEIQDVYPLSPMQEGMLFHILKNPQSAAYTYQIAYPVTGHLDLQLLEESLNLLIGRHDILRTVFRDKMADRNLQVVMTNRKVKVPYLDLQSFTGQESQERLEAFLEADRKNLFDLANGPILRVAIIQTQASQFHLVWTSHHILMDGWCFGILVEEFLHLYQSRVKGQKAQLPSARQYREYIQWLEQQDMTKSEEYWKDYLQGFDTISTLAHRAKASTQKEDFNSKESQLEFSQEEADRIYSLCREWHITPSIFLQSAWGLLLARYNNADDVVFGKTVSGRPPHIEGIERMAGLFVNTIPVRMRLDEGQSFRDIVALQQQEFLENQPHHYCAYTSIQAQSELKQMLLDHSFVVQNLASVSDSSKEDTVWEVGGNAQAKEHTSFDLVVVVYTGDQIKIVLEYNAFAFEEAYMQQLSRHLRQLVLDLIDQPDKRLGDLALMTKEEKYFLQQINDTHYPIPSITVLDLLRDLAINHPQSIALYYQQTSWSYLELERYSNQLANYLLRQYDLQKGMVVALRMERSAQAIATMLAVLKTGASYLTIDRSFPTARMQFILDDSGARLLIFDLEDIDSGACPKVNIEQIDLTGMTTKAPDVIVTPADVMYTIYTSGSTGKPKGVQIRHESLVNYILHNQRQYQLLSTDRSILMSSMAFDLGYTSIWTPLATGGSQVILPENDFLEIEALLALLLQESITLLKITPSTFNLLVNDSRFLQAIGDLELRWIVLGGEKIRLEDIQKYLDKAKLPVSFVDEYGPTETTIGVTNFIINQENLMEALHASLEGTNIGRPIANAQMYVLNNGGQDAGIGMIGELCIGGKGLAVGYLNRLELTAEKFAQHPTRQDIRIYRTGDLARWLPNGDLEYLGRRDEQIKVRGYRIELGEIEAVIRQQANIRDVVVLPIREATEISIAAYLILDEGVETDQIRAYLEEAVPAYMMPHFLIPMATFPQLANGKTDRKAFPNPQAVLRQHSEVLLTAQNEVESLLVQAFEKVMRISPIGMNEDFFSLGGDSIRAMQIIAFLYQAGYQLEIKEIFSTPVLSEMVHHLQPLDETETDDGFSFDDFEDIESDEMDIINQIINS